TSMAAATTSGAVALLIEASRKELHRTLPPNALKAILEYTALPMVSYDALTQGSGSLNVSGALEVVDKIDPSAAAAAPWLQSPLTNVTTIDGVVYPWSRAIIWGSAVIWGSNVVWDDPSTWANAVIWGSNTIGTSNGTAVIWGSTAGLGPDTVAWGRR